MAIEIKVVKGGFRVEGEWFASFKAAELFARDMAAEYSDLTGVKHQIVRPF